VGSSYLKSAVFSIADGLREQWEPIRIIKFILLGLISLGFTLLVWKWEGGKPKGKGPFGFPIHSI
jgi:hypothetical protein